MDIIKGQIYRHFKGNLYKVLTLAEDSETGRELVIYQALYGENKIYARQLSMFTERLSKDKYPEATQEHRFEIWDEVNNDESDGTNENGEALNPDVIRFLDTKDFAEKLRILQGLKNEITDSMIDTMAFSIDIELNEGTTDERYKELLNCVSVRERFENSRLRE